MNKPLIDLTDDELNDLIRSKAANVQYAYNDIMAELDRRTLRDQAKQSHRATIAGVIIAAIAVVIATAGILVQIILD